MTDRIPASASFDAPAGQAESTSAAPLSEAVPADSLATSAPSAITPRPRSTPPVERPSEPTSPQAAVHAVPLSLNPESAVTASSPEPRAAEQPPSEEDFGPPPTTFAEMALRDDVLRAVTEMGFTEPMPVQRRTYRPLMAGRDLIVQSRTGSGKTAAFGIPFVQGLVDPAVDCKNGRIQALVLGPTRELALQVGNEVSRIAAHRGLAVTTIYGGAPMGKQTDALRDGSHIVAGTPGRVLDHLRRGTLHLGSLRTLVLDEADEMLSMGFLEDIIEILRRCPAERQTLLFSATMPDDVVRLAHRHQRSPLMLQLSADHVGVNEIAHAYYMVSGMGRNRDLLRVLQVERPDSAMIFCNTREETSQVAEFLRSQGLDAEAISSDLTQAERERVMGRMKRKALHYLVATDVAARGIDISDLSHVLNYTFPESAEVYIHRTGRTGRAGKAGIAISLISPRELGNFYYLKLTYKIRPAERTLPNEAELQTLREGQYIDRLQREFLHKKPPAEFRSLLRRVLASDDSERLLSLLLEQYLAARTPAHSPAAETEGRGHGHGASHAAQSGSHSHTAAPPSDSGRRERPAPSEPRREPARDDFDNRRRGRGRERDDSRRERPPIAAGSESEAGTGAAPREPAQDRRGPNFESGRPPRHRTQPPAPPVSAAAAPTATAPTATAPVATAPAPTPAPPAPNDIIHVEDGRDFWEAWVDSRQAPTGEAPTVTGAAPEDADSSDRRGRRRRRERPEYVPTAGEIRLYLNLGRRDQVTEETLQEFLTQRGLVQHPIELHSTHTYMYVPEALVDQIITALHGASYGQRAVLCERARR